MTDMRDKARDILNAHCEYMGGMDAGQAFIRIENALKAVEAALSLMQPEIDRRVAEERAKLLERLREPSEGMLDAGEQAWMCRDLNDPNSHPIRDCFCAMLAQFEKENSDDKPERV